MRFNLWEDCNRVPLTELLSFIVDNRGKTVPTAPSGHKLIATNCVTNNTLFPVYEKIRYLSEETYQTWFRAHPIPGDILFVNKGTPGRVCLVPDPVDFCIAQDMIALRADESKIYPKYLFAVLRSREIQQQIYNTNVGDVIPHFKKQFLNQLLIPIPERSIQESIGDLYYVLSLKAERNKKINDNLQQQAAALFSSLYDRTNTEVRFTDLIQILGGGTPKTGENTYWNGNIAFFTPKDVGTPYTLSTEKTITEEGLSHCNSRLYPVNTVFVTARGTVGKVGMSGVPMAMNQSCYALVGKETHQLLVYFYTLKTVDRLKHKASGAVFDAITTRDFESEQIMKLSDEDAKSFLCIAAPMFQKVLDNGIENQRLSTLRDSLLPKLMSGEIDVSAVQL
ncbi:MAG TPA: restriction endonuclease subunit S [Clostridiales bacterium]|nr:restriction endonuclease subunit S [Clostridiales bacterium]